MFKLKACIKNYSFHMSEIVQYIIAIVYGSYIGTVCKSVDLTLFNLKFKFF